MADAPYSGFTYPLNVFMHVLTREEGGVEALHYGIFASPGETLPEAQRHSTELLLERLPPPPAKLLDAGCGIGTTLRQLAARGYVASGVNPDPQQVAAIGAGVDVRCVAFEAIGDDERYDTVFFQESSQYIDAALLFRKAAAVTSHVVVLDEFTAGDDPAATLHRFDEFLSAAAGNGFVKTEELDLSDRASPTMDYFSTRIPKYRDELTSILSVPAEQIDALMTSGAKYQELYRRGVYVYRLLQFRKTKGTRNEAPEERG